MAQKRRWTRPSSSDNDIPPAPAKPRWQKCSSDEDGFRCSGGTKRRWLHQESSSNSEDVSKNEQPGTRACGSTSESEDVWQRRSGAEARGRKRKATDIQDSGVPKFKQDLKPKPRPWALSDDDDPQSCSSGQQCSGVPARAKRQRKPVVNLTLEALQLKADSCETRGSVTQFEEWGMSEQRVRKVLAEPACSCTKACYKQLDFGLLSGICRWYHGHLTHSERQFVIYTLYQAATNSDKDVLEENTVKCRVQWQLQGGATTSTSI